MGQMAQMRVAETLALTIGHRRVVGHAGRKDVQLVRPRNGLHPRGFCAG